MNKEKNGKIVVLDIETTGLSQVDDSIVEIGICVLDLKTEKVDPLFSAVCKERNKIVDEDSWVFLNSDLPFELVIESPYLERFRDPLQRIFFMGYPVAAYNSQFDFGFLEARKFKIPNKFWDPMLKLTPIIKLRGGRFGGYKWPSVQEAWYYFFADTGYNEAHRALDDAIHEAKIINETKKILEGK